MAAGGKWVAISTVLSLCSAIAFAAHQYVYSIPRAAGSTAGAAPDVPLGYILTPSSRSGYCRQLIFDNKNGRYYEAEEALCIATPPTAQKPEPELAKPLDGSKRLQAVQRAFQR